MCKGNKLGMDINIWDLSYERKVENNIYIIWWKMVNVLVYENSYVLLKIF